MVELHHPQNTQNPIEFKRKQFVRHLEVRQQKQTINKAAALATNRQTLHRMEGKKKDSKTRPSLLARRPEKTNQTPGIEQDTRETPNSTQIRRPNQLQKLNQDPTSQSPWSRAIRALIGGRRRRGGGDSAQRRKQGRMRRGCGRSRSGETGAMTRDQEERRTRRQGLGEGRTGGVASHFLSLSLSC
jgi:hypothetical protein